MNQLATTSEVFLPEEPSEDRFELVEYWRSISRRKWSVIGLALVITLLTGVLVFSIKPVYRSTATILIETGKSKVVSVEEVYGGMSANREFFQTQAEIMRSRELARKVIGVHDPRAVRQKQTGGGRFSHPHAAGQTANFHWP